MKKIQKYALGLLSAVCFSSAAQAVVIDFTGGTATMHSNATAVTNNSSLYSDVAKYEEAGFRMELIGGSGFGGTVGNYYNTGNDVLHAHWATGPVGPSGVTRIKFSRIDGAAFDLNYFVLTSNTEIGGGHATGSERTDIIASVDGLTASYSQLLPSEDWGFPAQSINLGSQFDSIKAFWFEAENSVFCFGMDSFYIDEPAPNAEVPLPGSLSLAALGLFGLGAAKRRKTK